MSEKIRVEWRNPGDLRPHPRNPRHHSPESVEHVAALIERYGWTQPILLDETDTVLAGHKRRLAALKRGDESVPVVVKKGLSDADKLAYVIADNQATFSSPWDYDQLTVAIGDLKTQKFEIGLLGFSDISIDGLTAEPAAAHVYEEHHFWPVIRLKVPPRVFERWNKAFGKIEGESDGDRVKAILETLGE